MGSFAFVLAFGGGTAWFSGFWFWSLPVLLLLSSFAERGEAETDLGRAATDGVEDDGVAETGVGHAGTARRLFELLERGFRIESTDGDDRGAGVGTAMGMGMGTSRSVSLLSFRRMSLRERILRKRSSVAGRFGCCG